ncbi:IgGFc-binding protein-like [Petromyzon marinus]|uniref:IgGFc-binding protein-like n=1 Tax=Petromyzon marinus TaxID=7757 RepID=UPI003F719986
MYICQGGSTTLGYSMDPFQMSIIPTSKFSNKYLFATQPDFINILIVIAKDADKCGIVINNGTLCDKIQWVRTNDLQFVAGELKLGLGNQQFLVEHATQTFGLYLYGVASYDSFGYVLSYGNLRGNGAGSSVGRQFFGAFMQNYVEVVDALVVDFASYDSSTQVTISVPAVNFSQAVLLPPFSVGNVSIPVTAEIAENGIVTNKVVSVRSDSDISVWGMSKRSATTDGFMMIPEQELGTEYYVVAPVSGSSTNEFAIVSPYNNVMVQIILSGNVIFNGVTYSNNLNITLQEDQVVQFQGSALTGTRVLSSQPVAVFSGDRCIAVHTACNFVTEQLLPVRQWGSSYLVFPVSIKSTNDSVIITSPSSASIRVNVSVDGNFTTYTLTNYGRISVPIYANQTLSINSSVNVGVMYICQGGSTTLGYSMDPFQMNIIPTSKFSNMYLFATQPDFINILIVIVKDADKCGIVINNKTLCDKIQWVRTSDLQFVAGELNLGLGNQQFRVEHATQTFGLYLYGVASYDSFGYVLGYGNLRGGVCRINPSGASGTVRFADLLARPNVGDCLWTITGGPGTAVILRFQTFSLQAGAEVVYVYDGPSVDSPLLGKYAGDGVPAPIISSSNALSVRATNTATSGCPPWTPLNDLTSTC